MVLYFWRWDADAGVYTKRLAVDTASSVIWISKYNEPGEFEVYIRDDSGVLGTAYAWPDECIITRDDSDTAMIVDKVHSVSDAENGNYITISGKSTENILKRRVVVYQFNFSGTAENCIRQLITENCIDAYEPNRNITGLALGASQGYTDTVDVQFLGENLLDIVQGICETFGYGFRIKFNGSFVFELYKGTDRSENQSENPRLIFSHEMQNVASIDWEFDKTPLKNLAAVGGEGEGVARKIQFVYTSAQAPASLRRREMWVDASGISSKVDGGDLPESDYRALLTDAGKTELAENGWRWIMNMEALQVPGYMYGVDYYLGDKVTTRAEHFSSGITSRVSEVTQVEDESGIRVIPKFKYEG